MNGTGASSQPQQIVAKLWNYCNILRDDGLSHSDYVEQLSFLLFLKMADEQSHAPLPKPSPAQIVRMFGGYCNALGVGKLACAERVARRHIVAEVERRFSLADDLDRIVSANLHRATRLRQSILAAAFSGRLVLATSPAAGSEMPRAAEAAPSYGAKAGGGCG